MIKGFATGIFGDAKNIHLIISEESATYRPEMQWMAQQLGDRFKVQDAKFTGFQEGDAVYRFFEMFATWRIFSTRRKFSNLPSKRKFV